MVDESILHYNNDGLEFMKFTNLQKYDNVLTHAFSTRLGGISKFPYNSLNLGFNTEDNFENVLENYNIFLKELNIPFDNLVFSNQVHEDKILSVDHTYKFKKSLSAIKGYDGLITNEPNVALVTFFADCVPILLFDPINKVISAVHSGWKGTVKEIARKALAAMSDKYGTNKKNVEIAIGPCIGECCFKSQENVYQQFQNLGYGSEYIIKIDSDTKNIDLQGFIKQSLVLEGADPAKINIAKICTKCNNNTFFSYRGDNEKTGRLAALIMLRGDELID